MKMTNAERLSVATSLVAIVVSLMTAFLQFFWRNDELRVQWYFEHAGIPSLVFVPKTEPTGSSSIRVNMSPTIVFANTGNQNVTVIDVSLVLLQAEVAPIGNVWRHGENPPLSKCNDPSLGGAVASWERIAIDNDTKDARPMVIDSGKSVPVRVWFRQLEETVDDSWRANSEVTTCFSFQVIDSSGRGHSKRIPAQRFSSSGGAGEGRKDAIDLL